MNQSLQHLVLLNYHPSHFLIFKAKSASESTWPPFKQSEIPNLKSLKWKLMNYSSTLIIYQKFYSKCQRLNLLLTCYKKTTFPKWSIINLNTTILHLFNLLDLRVSRRTSSINKYKIPVWIIKWKGQKVWVNLSLGSDI